MTPNPEYRTSSAINIDSDGIGSVVRERPRGDMFYEQGLRDSKPRRGRGTSGGLRLLWLQACALRVALHD